MLIQAPILSFRHPSPDEGRTRSKAESREAQCAVITPIGGKWRISADRGHTKLKN